MSDPAATVDVGAGSTFVDRGSTLHGSSSTLVQPLHSLPSVLGMRDVRAAILRATRIGSGREDVEALLALDPLTTIRALRLASAPLWAPMRPPESIRELVATLGVPAIQRMLDVEPVEVERTASIRALWLHSVATAAAAEVLADHFGAAEPKVAYLRGLTHDLSSWLEQLGRHHDGRAMTLGGEDLIRLWKLPLPLEQASADDESVADDPSVGDSPRDPIAFLRLAPQALVEAADQLAVLAGFPHPGQPSAPIVPNRELEQAIGWVRESVAAALERVGLTAATVAAADADPAGDDLELALFGGRQSPNLNELVSRLVGCGESRNYGTLNTLATAAALRFLDFDRAFVVSWSPACRRVWVRGKADLTELGVQRRPLRPTDRESEILAEALETLEPLVLVRGDPREGLCGALGADRAILVPLRGNQRLPSFLVVDRAPTARYLDLAVDGTNARILAGFLAFAMENLELRLRRRRAERNATIDPLTGLANRGVGLFTLGTTIAAAQRNQAPLCVMMIDLDEFKQLNDTYGHLVGDHALRVTSAVLRRTMRGSDTICRYGGEEFLVVLPETSAEDATILATRLFTAVGEAGRAHGLPITCSIGLSSLRPTDSLDDLVGRADSALYASKSRGRNRFSADTD
ncbi:MAG: diguanylate cyclase [Planctomycetota bacterium]